MSKDTVLKYPAIILAAGTSDRMGYPKAALKFNDSNNFTQHLCNQFIKAGSRNIYLVINNKTLNLFGQINITFQSEVNIIINNNPEFGRIFSLKMALLNCKDAEAVFVTNVDNPYVDKILLQKLSSEIRNADYIYPVYKNKGGHPIIITKKIITEILNLNEGDINLQEFFKGFKTKTIKYESDKIHTNINDKNDYLLFE